MAEYTSSQNDKMGKQFGTSLAITFLLFGTLIFFKSNAFGIVPVLFEILGIFLIFFGFCGLGSELSRYEGDPNLDLGLGLGFGSTSLLIMSYNLPHSSIIYLPMAFIGVIFLINSFLATNKRQSANLSLRIVIRILEIIGTLSTLYTVYEFFFVI